MTMTKFRRNHRIRRTAIGRRRLTPKRTFPRLINPPRVVKKTQ
jgi:hypothetical protein